MRDIVETSRSQRDQFKQNRNRIAFVCILNNHQLPAQCGLELLRLSYLFLLLIASSII